MKPSLLPLTLAVLLSFVLVQCEALADLEVKDKEPKQVQLIAPLSGAYNQNQDVELIWNEVVDDIEYRIMISESAQFDEYVVNEIVTQPSFKTDLLNPESTYYWKVQPLHDDYYGGWSETWFFSTAAVETDPVSVELFTPQSGSEVEAEDIHFQWRLEDGSAKSVSKSAVDSTEFHFQLSDDADFTTIIEDTVITITEFNVALLKDNEDFFWRVSPLLKFGTGTWSQPADFRTKIKEVTAPPAPSSNFVTAVGGDFTVNGSPFRYAGTNAYHLPNYQKIDPGAVNRAFDSFEGAGVTVVRMWGFYDGPAQYSNDITIQPQAGEYNEEGLVALDEVIAKGKESGVRFILPFVNYWSQLGGVDQYNEWDGNPEGGMQHFINDEDTQQWFKDYIHMLLNRVNTVTGVAYKDEPAIFSWEIMNEGRLKGADPTELRDWYQEMAQYIKSIDSNHMVSTGEEGFDEGTPDEYSRDQYSNTYVLRTGEGTSYVLNTAIPEIDYGTAHWYPAEFGWFISEWGLDVLKDENLIKAQHAWLKDHIAIAEAHDKPFLLGEYGYPGWADERVENVYRDLWEQAEGQELDGSLIWQFTADHVKCYEYGGNICWPGGRADATLYDEFKIHIDAMAQQN